MTSRTAPLGGKTLTERSRPISVLVADDHPLLRDGIAALINAESDITLAATCSSGREAIQQFRTLRPDVTLMDMQMPEMSGLEAMIEIRSEFPSARVVVLTSYEGDKQIADHLQVTEDTVKGRVQSILSKLDANDRTHAVTIGLKRGIIGLS